MIYSQEVQHMCCVKKGANHPSAPIPEEGKWIRAKEIKDISGLTHGIGWCAPQQGACKLTLNVKNGVIQEALVETLGCSGMTHSAAMASEILPGKTILEALNTDLVCDAINTAMVNCFFRLSMVAASRLSLKVVWPWVLRLRIWVRACAARWALCSARLPRGRAILRWLRATAPVWDWMPTAR